MASAAWAAKVAWYFRSGFVSGICGLFLVAAELQAAAELSLHWSAFLIYSVNVLKGSKIY